MILVLCFVCVGCSNIGDGEDIKLDGIVYKRSVFPNYNMWLSETDRFYVGDYIQIYEYGQELPWEVYALNEERNVLYSAHAIWLKPGYVLPDEYGENFSQAEYVISEGILDDYTEESTLITTFTEEVKLENIINSEPTQLENVESFGDIRLTYTDHKNINIRLTLCKSGETYYLNVLEDVRGDSVYYEIKEGYVSLLTSAL